MKIHTRDAEVKLVEMLSTIKGDLTGWRFMHLHFSGLLDHYKSPYQTKIALNLVKDYVKNGDGGVFGCEDKDIIILCKAVSKPMLEKMVFRLRYLFSDDPLAYSGEGEENNDFSSLRDVSVAWDHIYETAKKKMATATQMDVKPTVKKEQIDIKPLTPTRLASIEEDMAKADLSRTMRRQPICAARPGEEIRRVFDEFYINISHLRKIIRGNVDFLSNRWLFKYLTQILDVKMLDMLRKRPGDYFDAPVSLNLNVDTLLSDKFSVFDAAIQPSIKVTIVVEIQISDVFADMSAFQVARQTLQKQGYRICLDGLNPDSFMQVNRDGLGFDLAKLQWNADLTSDLSKERNVKLKKAIDKAGANRVILCHCDNRSAVEYGQALGISLFQGRYLDNLLNPDAKVTN